MPEPATPSPVGTNAYEGWRERNPWWHLGLSAVPGVGSGVSLADAGSSFRRGNYLASLGHTGMALLGLIPGVGAVKSVGKLLTGAGKATSMASRTGQALTTAGNAMGSAMQPALNATRLTTIPRQLGAGAGAIGLTMTERPNAWANPGQENEMVDKTAIDRLLAKLHEKRADETAETWGGPLRAAAFAPEGHRMEGFGRGMATQTAAMAAGALGMYGGLRGGQAINNKFLAGKHPGLAGAGGIVAGGIGAGYLGAKLMQRLMGKPSWKSDREWKKESAAIPPWLVRGTAGVNPFALIGGGAVAGGLAGLATDRPWQGTLAGAGIGAGAVGAGRLHGHLASPVGPLAKRELSQELAELKTTALGQGGGPRTNHWRYARKHLNEPGERPFNEFLGASAVGGIGNALGKRLDRAGEKQAFVDIGALIGAIRAPTGYRLEGAGRGGVAGLGTLLGAGLGVGGGAMLTGGPVGAAIGGIGGGFLGFKGTRKLMGKPSWEKEKKNHKEKDDAKDEKSEKQAFLDGLGRLAGKGLGAFGSLFGKGHWGAGLRNPALASHLSGMTAGAEANMVKAIMQKQPGISEEIAKQMAAREFQGATSAASQGVHNRAGAPISGIGPSLPPSRVVQRDLANRATTGMDRLVQSGLGMPGKSPVDIAAAHQQHFHPPGFFANNAGNLAIGGLMAAPFFMGGGGGEYQPQQPKEAAAKGKLSKFLRRDEKQAWGPPEDAREQAFARHRSPAPAPAAPLPPLRSWPMEHSDFQDEGGGIYSHGGNRYRRSQDQFYGGLSGGAQAYNYEQVDARGNVMPQQWSDATRSFTGGQSHLIQRPLPAQSQTAPAPAAQPSPHSLEAVMSSAALQPQQRPAPAAPQAAQPQQATSTTTAQSPAPTASPSTAPAQSAPAAPSVRPTGAPPIRRPAAGGLRPTGAPPIRPGYKQSNILDELKSQWNGLDLKDKAITGAGGALALGSLVNQFRPRAEGDHASLTGNTLGTLGGLAAAAYGMSGSKLDNVMPTLQKLTGHKSAPSTGGNRFLNPDGSFKIQDLLKAKDEELKPEINRLTPEQRGDYRNRMKAFTPSFTQRLGAKATGVDIEGQKSRFDKLLA